MENIETAMQAAEQTADQQDAFLQGFGDDDMPETEQAADQQTEQEEAQQQTEGAETTVTEESAETAETESGAGETETTETEGDANAEQQKEAETAPISWTIKHMGESKTLAVTDITPELLQKGMDYDRIRGKYDEAKPVMEMFSEFAKSANMSVADYVKFIRTEAKKASGVSEAEAKRAVELEDREAAVAAKEAQQNEAATEKTAQDAKVQADLADFEKAFPTVYAEAKKDPKAIPQSVWDDVKTGMSLTAAYSRYALAKANEAIQAEKDKAAVAEQVRKNGARSTGSQRSAGNDSKNTDPFLEGFGS